MRIACLQFAPTLGEVDRNVQRADRILEDADLTDIDLLVLPEMAFSGYNFPSFDAIQPYLEPTSAGISTSWARIAAKKLNCIVSVGYPEISDERFEEDPASNDGGPGSTSQGDDRDGSQDDERNIMTSSAVPVPKPVRNSTGYKCYNSTITVGPDGSLLYHYRKTFLFYTDATWAAEGQGFGSGKLPLTTRNDGHVVAADTTFAHAICMDINPRAFTTPWTAFEFGNHAAEHLAELIILTMAWSSRTLNPVDVMGHEAIKPDYSSIVYWIERLMPVMEAEGRRAIVICANRCGTEGDTTYVGTSSVMALGNGEAKVWNSLGKGEEAVLLVDTDSTDLMAEFHAEPGI